MANRDDDDAFGCCGLIWMAMVMIMTTMMTMMMMLMSDDVHRTPWWFVRWPNRWFANAAEGVLTWFDIVILLYILLALSLLFPLGNAWFCIYFDIWWTAKFIKSHNIDKWMMIHLHQQPSKYNTALKIIFIHK